MPVDPETSDWLYDADRDDPPNACKFSGTRQDGTCGQSAVIIVTVACVHEHVHANVPVCQYHSEEVTSGDSYCFACMEAGEDYCPLVFDPRGARDLEAAHPEVFASAREVSG
jgi:hypothetical protein